MVKLDRAELIEKYKNTDRVSFIIEDYIHAYQKYLIENKESLKLSDATINDIIVELYRFEKFLFFEYPELKEAKDLNDIHIDSYRKFCHKDLLVMKRTANKKLRAIRKFFDYLKGNWYLFKYNPALNVPYYKVYKDEPEKTPSSVPKDILNTIFTQLGRRKYGIRELTISQFLAYTGLQLKEILDLRTDNIDMERKTISLLRGKDNYTIEIPQPLYKSLKSYLALRENELMGSFSNYLFLSNTGKRYSARSYQYAFKNTLKRAKISGGYTPRNIKSSFSYNMAKSVTKERLKIILHQNKVEHYYINDIDKNPLLPKR